MREPGRTPPRCRQTLLASWIFPKGQRIVDTVADIVADIVVDTVADIVVDLVVDTVADIVADIVVDLVVDTVVDTVVDIVVDTVVESAETTAVNVAEDAVGPGVMSVAATSRGDPRSGAQTAPLRQSTLLATGTPSSCLRPCRGAHLC